MKKLLQLLLAGMIPLSLSACSAAKSEPIGGYLAIYPALYEPDMGVEYAQFPSKEYTDTYRTDVLYCAISKDGGDTALLRLRATPPQSLFSIRTIFFTSKISV